MDERLRSFVAAWVERSRDDLGAARLLSGGDVAYPAVALFHCQQSVEKALKAYLASKDEAIRKTHDLELLVEACEVFDPEFHRFRDFAADLNPYAVEFRYPSSAPDPPPGDARLGVEMAQIVLDFVLEKLGFLRS